MAIRVSERLGFTTLSEETGGVGYEIPILATAIRATSILVTFLATVAGRYRIKIWDSEDTLVLTGTAYDITASETTERELLADDLTPETPYFVQIEAATASEF